jgi:flagellar hook-associated protein 3 FlgL
MVKNGCKRKSINSAIEHVVLQQAKLGAKIQATDTQIDIINHLRTTVIEDVSELEDADLAEVVTELKQLLLNKDAAQQVYAKLNQQTLFDFIR